MDASELDTRFRTLFIIWASLALGVFWFVIAVWAITSGVIPDVSWTPLEGFDEALLLKVVALPTLLLMAGIVFRRGEIGRPGMDADAKLGAYQTRVIVATAIQETGGLAMSVLALLSGLWSWAVGFGALTLFAMVLIRPRKDEMQTLLR